ncbi:MAG TPA: BamA/TamA family outer membrane protein, partial [Pirellulales bacterium]
PTEGHYVDLAFEQAVGSFHFPRGTIDARQHFLLHERPDHSGRQVLNFITNLGYTGGNTPIYENFYAGGYATLRGFYFRGASPQDMNVIVGGKFQWLNSVEYMFPLMADDMLRGVVFCDFGTVEQVVSRVDPVIGNGMRVAPGFGLRINVPAMGPAPIALDLAFPIVTQKGDEEQVFSFFVGVGR